MNIEGDICEYIRGRKNKHLAIETAMTIFCQPREFIIATLQAYGLMDQNKQYIEPVRLTGKEVSMEKRKINYPSFAWSPKRQEKLKELYQANIPVSEIAAYFEIGEGVVYTAITKFGIVRLTQKEALPLETLPTVHIDTPTDGSPEVNVRPMQKASGHLIALYDAEYIQVRIMDALFMIDAITANLNSNNERDGYFVLGQLQGLLFELKRLMRVEG